MLSVKEIREKLEDSNLAKVAIKAGVSYRSLYYLMNDGGTNPSQELLTKLSEYLGEE